MQHYNFYQAFSSINSHTPANHLWLLCRGSLEALKRAVQNVRLLAILEPF